MFFLEMNKDMENSLRIRNAKEGRDVTSSVVSPSCSLMYGKY